MEKNPNERKLNNLLTLKNSPTLNKYNFTYNKNRLSLNLKEKELITISTDIHEEKTKLSEKLNELEKSLAKPIFLLKNIEFPFFDTSSSNNIFNSISLINLNSVRDFEKKINEKVEFERFREIADEVGAFLHGDICHNAGLIATELHPSPFPHCHVVSTSTHKTLRGPRGGIILMGKDFENPYGIVAPKTGRTKMMSELLDAAVMPGIQGGPLMHVIAGKAVAFKEALKPSFKTYIQSVLDNAQCFAEEFKSRGYDIISGGTDTHLILLDLQNKNITGKQAEHALDLAGITLNKNMVPFDPKSPFITSGVRIGSPALTTRGMGVEEVKIIANLIDKVIMNSEDENIINSVRKEVKELCKSFPIY